MAIAALVVALAGLVAALLASGYVLTKSTQRLDVDPQGLAQTFRDRQQLDDLDAFYRAMIAGLSMVRRHSDTELWRMHRAFTCMLCGILVELCGLALAAAIP